MRNYLVRIHTSNGTIEDIIKAKNKYEAREIALNKGYKTTNYGDCVCCLFNVDVIPLKQGGVGNGKFYY